ncbi:MAG: hypothetical protein J7502_05810, partial [Flavisolibacter sp.]|nr:hypothetical protein [Flavisolibacter sp.]
GGSLPVLLAVAYQNEQQVWQTAKIVEKDTANKKITVSTTHFSDWSLFRSLELVPGEARLNLGESRNLFVRRVIPVSSPDELEAPTPGTFLSAQEASSEIRDWRLIGVGTLTPQGAKAVYTAPSSVPDWTPVVNVRLKNAPGNMELTLVCNITILWEGARWRVDGGPWITGRSPGAVLVSGVNSIRIHADKNATETILIDWKHNSSLPADYPWNLNGFPTFTYTVNGPYYLHIYPVSPNVGAPSPGSLKITEYDARPGGYVAGTFTLDKAAKYNTCPTCGASLHKIEGSFRVKWAGQ